MPDAGACGIRALLEKLPEVKVIAEVIDGRDALRQVKTHQPECLAAGYCNAGAKRIGNVQAYAQGASDGARLDLKMTGKVENRLLAALPVEEYERLRPHLEQVSFALGEVIYESGGHLDYVYFPITAIISLLYLMEDGSSAEMGLAGNDGVVGIALFMGGGTMPNRAVVQSAGAGIRMKAKVLQEEFARGGQFQKLLLRYTQALITQISQTAVCNRLHSVEQQLCRWLLLSHDRVQTDELLMTQTLIANMLGVSREGVTIAAGRLQDLGAISYVRGHIKILDRKKLEATVCECYRVVKDEFDRLLG